METIKFKSPVKYNNMYFNQVGDRLRGVNGKVSTLFKPFESFKVALKIAGSESGAKALMAKWEQIGKMAADKGSVLHQFAQDYLEQDREPTLPNEVHLAQYLDKELEGKEFSLYCELPVYKERVALSFFHKHLFYIGNDFKDPKKMGYKFEDVQVVEFNDVVGIIDLVVETEDEVILYDYKTTEKDILRSYELNQYGWSDNKYNRYALQLIIYSQMLITKKKVTLKIVNATDYGVVEYLVDPTTLL